MAAMNSSVLACSYAISGTGASELTSKYAVSMTSPSLQKLPLIIKAQQQSSNKEKEQIAAGRRVALLGLAAALFTSATSSANAGVIDDYLEKSKANKGLFDLENTNEELKSELKDVYINSAAQIDVSGNMKAVVAIHVPYKLRKSFSKVHVKLVRELEKEFSGKDVIFVASRGKRSPPSRSGSAAQRPSSRTLTEGQLVPAEIYRVDGSKIMKVDLELNNTEYKLDTFSAVYRKFSAKNVVEA